MIYLTLSILSSTVILVLFKLFKTHKVHNEQAIVFNYLIACICGLLAFDQSISLSHIVASEWVLGALLLGFLFVFIFNVMALTAQKNGLSVVSVASKMSVVIPVIAGVTLYHEVLDYQSILGILVALTAVILSSLKNKDTINLKDSLYLPFILFLGSGIIDAALKYFETTHVPNNEIPLFSATIFFSAGFFGLIQQFLTKKMVLNQSLITSGVAGTALGIVNYFSVFFLLKTLQLEQFQSATIFTINNVAIVVLGSLLGFVIFKESLSKWNLAGVGLGILAILLMSTT